MDFLLKKGLAAWMLPLPISLTLIFVGIIFLIINYYRAALISFIGSFFVLLIFSTGFLPTYLLHKLEAPYHPLKATPHQVKYIVVLGGGNRLNQQYPVNSRLTAASLARLIEAIRLYKQIPTSTLILSGGKTFNTTTDATLLQKTAQQLGVNSSHIRLETQSHDTEDEVIHLKKMLNQQPFILVTSAFHMRRTLDLFAKYNMQPIPAPTQFLIDVSANPFRYYFPSSRNLEYSDIVLHEYLGILWYHLAGKL